MSIRILFVDDEPLLLSGLQRSLRPLRKEWRATFALGGEEALEALAREPFDVVVTDMRMPGMDGAALLHEVMRLYPDMLRLVLSGQSDMESVVKSAGVTHQYLSKPCSIEVLKDAVNRAVSLHQFLADSSLKQLLSRLHSIPSVPPLYVELMQCVKSNEASIEKVSAIIQKDMGMSAKVLQLANSALGAAGRIASTVDAVVYLGLDAIRTLLLTLHAFSEFQPTASSSFPLQGLWRHSLATGALAERIIQTLPADSGAHGQMRMIGLLHDVGRLVLAANLPEKLRACPPACRGEEDAALDGGTRGVRRHARRGGSVPHRFVGTAGTDCGGGCLPSRAGEVSPSGLGHADRVARRRLSRGSTLRIRRGVTPSRGRHRIPFQHGIDRPPPGMARDGLHIATEEVPCG